MDTARHNESTIGWPALEPIFLVRDVEASVAFYRTRLGFTLEARWEATSAAGEPVPGAILSARELGPFGGSLMVRIRLQQLEADQALPAPGAIVLIHVAERIDELASDFRKRGARLAAELTELPDGTRTFSVCDPNGHILHFAEIKPSVGGRHAEPMIVRTA